MERIMDRILSTNHFLTTNYTDSFWLRIPSPSFHSPWCISIFLLTFYGGLSCDSFSVVVFKFRHLLLGYILLHTSFFILSTTRVVFHSPVLDDKYWILYSFPTVSHNKYRRLQLVSSLTLVNTSKKPPLILP